MLLSMLLLLLLLLLMLLDLCDRRMQAANDEHLDKSDEGKKDACAIPGINGLGVSHSGHLSIDLPGNLGQSIKRKTDKENPANQLIPVEPESKPSDHNPHAGGHHHSHHRCASGSFEEKFYSGTRVFAS